MNTKEVWKDVKDYEEYYQVSNLGRVRSLRFNKVKLLKQSINHGGYSYVNLPRNKKPLTFTIHRLVAVAFLNHTPCRYKLVVNHINFNKLDNRVENLELVSNRENCNMKHIKSSSQYTGVTYFKRDDKWRASILINGKRIHLGLFKCEYQAHLSYQKQLVKLL